MYYVEKEIDGRWYFKATPNGDWHEFTTEHYCRKISELMLQIEKLNKDDDKTVHSN